MTTMLSRIVTGAAIMAALASLPAQAGGCYNQRNCLCPIVPAPIASGADTLALTLGADVNFDFNRAELKPAGAAAVAGFANDVSRMGGRKIVRVEGHTDSIGSASYNQSLSERRAATVQNALINQGIPAADIAATGYGETRPVADNRTATGRAQNRRVEITATRAPLVLR